MRRTATAARKRTHRSCDNSDEEIDSGKRSRR